MSNALPCCTLCNMQKASQLPGELEPSFVSPEQLMIIRTYLQAQGKRNQDNWRRLCTREPVFARMDEKKIRLKVYCEERAREAPVENAAYGYLRRMIFGIEWDSADYHQVVVSLHWQKQTAHQHSLQAHVKMHGVFYTKKGVMPQKEASTLQSVMMALLKRAIYSSLTRG
jgi:hypothetical protein